MNRENRERRGSVRRASFSQKMKISFFLEQNGHIKNNVIRKTGSEQFKKASCQRAGPQGTGPF